MLADPERLNPLALWSIILVEGFVTISVEILTIRQLLPFVGNSVIVTSLIIGIFLLFLAIGYLRGGRHTENYFRALKNNFTWAQALIGICMSFYFTNLFFQYLHRYERVDLVLVLGLYLLLVIAPIVYVLGQTVPITTNLFKQQLKIGRISGGVLFLSTLGSFLGAVLTSVLLLNFFGVAVTVVINVALLFFLTCVLMEKSITDFLRFGVLVFLLYYAYQFNIDVEKRYFIKTNNYSNTSVLPLMLGDEFGNALIINDSLSSFISPALKAAPYIEKIKKALFEELRFRNKDILVLGAGGFTFSAEGSYENRITYVDVDKDLKPIVEQHFLPKIIGDFVVADARLYLQDKTEQFDAIVTDTFNSALAIPDYLLTVEHLQALYAALRPDGYAIFNIAANPLLTDKYSKRVDNTITSVFGNCMKIPSKYANTPTNIIYLCHKSKMDADHTLYTDNISAATMNYFLK